MPIEKKRESGTLFCASDPGGARAVLPVLRCLQERGRPVVAVDHRFLGESVPDTTVRISADALTGAQGFAQVVRDHDISAVCVGSSLSDPIPLQVMSQAKRAGLRTVMVLDNWMRYRQRMVLDGELICPDVYAVMDDLARQEAVQDGIPQDCIQVTGHPDLAALADHPGFSSPELCQTVRQSAGCPTGRLFLLFISEPVEHYQGNDPAQADFRGYTEKTVLALFADVLQSHHQEVYIGLMAHPREDKTALERHWQHVRGKLDGGLTGLESRDALFGAQGVVGMSSLVLYQSWLLQLPTMSLQPGLLDRALCNLKHRQGLHFVTDSQCRAPIASWLEEARTTQGVMCRSELTLHHQAADRLATILSQ